MRNYLKYISYTIIQLNLKLYFISYSNICIFNSPSTYYTSIEKKKSSTYKVNLKLNITLIFNFYYIY